jgi:hypothetical protein
MCLALRFYRCSFKFLLKVGVEELIVNAPRISCLNTLFTLFVLLLSRLTSGVHNRLFNANFEEKFK